MFRSPQAGDWAAEEEDTSPLPTPTPPSPTAAPAPAPTRSQDARGGAYERSNSGGARFDRDRNSRDNGGRFDRGGDYGGGRFDRGGDYGGGRFDRGGGGRYDRDYDRGSGRFDRGRDYDRSYDRGGGQFERDDRGRYEGGGRADVGRWGHNADRRGGGDRGGRDLPVDQGFIVSIKENFGFVSCMERDGDLFFHISEAPVDIQLQDEVEFRVKYNQRSDKEMACQLVALPKGAINVEEVSEEVYDGVVTKGLPRGGHGGGRGFFNNRDDDRRQREEHGLIEVSNNEGGAETQETEDEKNEVDTEAQEQGDGEEKKTLVRREFVRFNAESVATSDVKSEEEDQDRPKKKPIPHFGDEVRFRIAKHRKTGAKRAVDIVIAVSAREKLEKEIEAKLATMTRETGVVDRVKNGGGFIKCCDRPVDVYFPFHEIREAAELEQDEKSSKTDDEQGDQRRQGKGPTLREGDEVSFFVYEEQEDESARSRSRLTALRVQKLPPGTVSFEELLRADVEGLVSKLPKEPRNGPEVIGAIAVASAEPNASTKSEEVKESAVETTGDGDAKSSKKKKGKNGKAKTQKVSFRLCDTEDMSYVPHIDDKVAFDEVLDKRTGKVKAVKVRVVQLNPKNRETGTINAMKEDFGFIKCAERSGDAYFRFSDVMGTSRSFNNGTEVAFDVLTDNKSDHIRATRIQILPRGTVKWEDVAVEALEGKIIAVPSSRRGHQSNRGGRGDKMKQLQKIVHGKITFVTPQKQHLIDFLPELKEKLDATFITLDDATEKSQEEAIEGEVAGKDEAGDKTEIRISLPSTLSKFERAALHEYSDWLGLKHESSGEGSHRQLEIVGSEKISIKTVEEKLAASAPELTVEFREDDVDDVRYNPHVGDRVKFDLVVVKRTKQFQCKSITCLEAASAKTKTAPAKNDAANNDAANGEGFIVSVKPEGFGFIQPAQTVPGSLEENLFFHIKEITTGQSLADLKEGTEVQYTIFVDEKKKKKRAMGISVVPAGTIKNVIPESVKGVVTKASYLHRMKSGPKGRFTKANNKVSTVGRIRLATAGNDAEDDDAGSDGDGDSDEEAEESEEASQTDAKSADAEPKADKTKQTDKKKGATQKKSDKQLYLYNIRDIADPSVVLREGDEVEFIPQVTPKILRAAHIRLIVSHAKQGVVVRVTEDLGGIIRIDGDEGESVVEARYTARSVLRGDVLSEGDRVEFAYRAPPATPAIKNKITTEKASEEEKSNDASGEEVAKDAAEPEPALGISTSVLRLSSSPNSAKATSKPRGSRTVNSTLKEAMRQVGANAMVASRMAKGPDGTRGFAEGWMSSETATEEKPAVNEEVHQSEA